MVAGGVNYFRVGQGTGADYNELNIGAAGGDPVTVTHAYFLRVGYSGAANNEMNVVNASLTTGTLYAGDAASNNTITVGADGSLQASAIYVGNVAGATGNKLVVNDGGDVYAAGGTLVVGNSGATGNSLIIDGGVVDTGLGPAWANYGTFVNAGNELAVRSGGQAVTRRNFNTAGTLQIGIDSASAGQVDVQGWQLYNYSPPNSQNSVVTLAGDLVVTVDTGNPPAAGTHTYIIIVNDRTADAVVGTFASATSGSAYLTVDSVSYTAGDGNDVAITVTYSPPPVCDCPALTTAVINALCGDFSANGGPSSSGAGAAAVNAAIAAAFTAAGCPLDDPCADEIRTLLGL